MTITYNGASSASFSADIFRKETDTAPAPDVQSIKIPGRNGDVVISNKRFNNVEMRYTAVFRGENAMEHFSDFKNYLLSQKGYNRLEDSEHPEEFYQAIVSRDIKPKLPPKRDLVKAEIIFSRKPQRFLKSGESTYLWIGGSRVFSGQTINAYWPRISADTFAVSSAHPYPERNPQSKPDNPITLDEPTDVSSFVITADGESLKSVTLPAQHYDWEADFVAGTFKGTGGVATIPAAYSGGTTPNWEKIGNNKFRSLTALSVSSNGAAAITECSHFTAGTGSPATISLDENGKVVIEWWKIGNTISAFCSRLAQLGTVKVAYAYETQPSASIETFFPAITSEGWVHLEAVTAPSADRSQITMEYADTGDTMINPTVYPSKPLIRVTGNGTATLNDITITIEDVDEYVDIDCDMMDCYEGSVNRNNNVTFSTYDFPELQSGTNTAEISGNIEKIEVTPRWWRL